MKLTSQKLTLFAPNIHTGGGVVLLSQLIAAWPDELPLHAWLDVRARSAFVLPMNARVEWVEPRVLSRIRAELSLSKQSLSTDRVLCFNGLPPIFRNKGEVVIFQQNRNYLNTLPLRSFAARTAIRLFMERAIAQLFKKRAARYLVQTPSMARDLREWYGSSAVEIAVVPFYYPQLLVERVHSAKWDFIYVADGVAHKNHRNLIMAWSILAQRGHKPTLAITLPPRDAGLLKWINQQANTYGLNITNLGHMQHEEILRTYGQTQALIFPSFNESYGLPLLEARKLGLPIVASELDFVRDVCEPRETFDPTSPLSIARAVQRFLKIPEAVSEPFSPTEFLNKVAGLGQNDKTSDANYSKV